MLAILAGRTHTCGPRGTLPQAVILIEGGKIVALEERLELPPGTQVVDASALTVMPGLVDAHTHLGLQREGLGVPDANEDTAPLNPHLRVLDAFDPLDEALADACRAGVTTVGVLPGSTMSFSSPVERISVIAGQGAVVKTLSRGEPVVLREPAALKLAFGDHPKRTFAEKKAPPATRMNIVGMLRESLVGARLYGEARAAAGPAGGPREAGNASRGGGARGGEQSGPAGEPTASGLPHRPAPPEYDLKKEALLSLLRREFPARAHVNRAQDILAALRLAEEFGFDLVLDHVTEGYLVADAIARRGVPCVVGPLPFARRGPELKNISLANPARLAAAGVRLAITTDSPTYPAGYLPVHAGMAVREGLPYEEALRAITISAATILGVADRVGSLEPGKDADLVGFTGDPLQATSRVGLVVVSGEIVTGEVYGAAGTSAAGGSACGTHTRAVRDGREGDER